MSKYIRICQQTIETTEGRVLAPTKKETMKYSHCHMDQTSLAQIRADSQPWTIQGYRASQIYRICLSDGHAMPLVKLDAHLDSPVLRPCKIDFRALVCIQVAEDRAHVLNPNQPYVDRACCTTSINVSSSHSVQLTITSYNPAIWQVPLVRDLETQRLRDSASITMAPQSYHRQQ